jgi:hypothetical protein
VLEIYPRLLTGAVVKSSPTGRKRYLTEHYPAMQPDLAAVVASDEDAFDAAVSALVMSANLDDISRLSKAEDPERPLEGEIWHPR